MLKIYGYDIYEEQEHGVILVKLVKGDDILSDDEDNWEWLE